MWIIGTVLVMMREYSFSQVLMPRRLIILTDAPESVAELAEKTAAKIVVRNGITPDQYRRTCRGIHRWCWF